LFLCGSGGRVQRVARFVKGDGFCFWKRTNPKGLETKEEVE